MERQHAATCGTEAGQWIGVVPQDHGPAAARRDALECGALHRFPLRVALDRQRSLAERGRCGNGGGQVCIRQRASPTRQVRLGMGKRRKAPHSKAAAAARNRQLPDWLRRLVRSSLVKEGVGQSISVTPRDHSPSAARRDALECGALRRFPSRVATGEERSPAGEVGRCGDG